MIALLASLAIPAAANAARASGAARMPGKPAKVEVEGVRLVDPPGGPAALMVGIRYPIQLDGHRVRVRVKLSLPGEGLVHGWFWSPTPVAGPIRLPERRRSFEFVHRIGLRGDLMRQIEAASGPPRIKVSVVANLDANDDGTPELASSDIEFHTPSTGPSATCTSVPQLRVEPGQTTRTTLPACGFAARWTVGEDGEDGHASIHDGHLYYRADKGFHGVDSFDLRVQGGGAARSSSVAAPMTSVRVVVGNPGPVSVRAIGDSVTAGFGYYGDGEEMSVVRLDDCKPAETFYNDACSSNSPTRTNEGDTVEYLPDYGLSNQVSWAAQWAKANGVTNYENLAVSGSEPKSWLPGGQLYPTLQKMEAEGPEYILMTLGANPLLSEMLFGIENMGCAIDSDIEGSYKECIERSFAGVELHQRLKQVYSELVSKTDATVYLMQYHLSVPSVALAYTAVQIAEMGQMLNEEIARTAAEVSTTRLHVIAPPHFNVGLNLEPVYPASYNCGSLYTDDVDGPSDQSTATKIELRAFHPLEFCGSEGGPPWVISGDTGIHPSATGYAQMAARVPPLG